MPINVCLKFMTLPPCIDQDYEGWFLLMKIFFHYFEGVDASVDLHELCGFPNSKGGFEPPVGYELGWLCYEVSQQ